MVADNAGMYDLNPTKASVKQAICGFGFPLVAENRMFVLVGGSVFFGSLLSARILYLAGAP